MQETLQNSRHDVAWIGSTTVPITKKGIQIVVVSRIVPAVPIMKERYPNDKNARVIMDTDVHGI